MWADIGGELTAIEVKTTAGRTWKIRKNQLGRSAWHVFAIAQTGRCWVVSKAELQGITKIAGSEDDYWVVGASAFPPNSEGGWLRMLPTRAAEDGAAVPHGKKEWRRRNSVRRLLADGTVKVYEYGPKGKTARILHAAKG